MVIVRKSHKAAGASSRVLAGRDRARRRRGRDASVGGCGLDGAAPVSLTSPSCPTNIVQGEFDGCVTELQDLLNQHGAGLGFDGDFGANKLAAVKTFQPHPA
jgi:hypothetical protein